MGVMTSAGGDLRSEVAEYLQGAAGSLAGRVSGYPTTFDYLSWIDACTVHVPDDPVRTDVQRLRSQALYVSGAPGALEFVRTSGEPAERILHALVQEARRGYPRLRHTMGFPAQAGFHPSSALQSADVFARAIVLETLVQAQHLRLLDCSDSIEQGIDYCIRVRRRGGSGGWAYFPGLLELAPDADTLAQVARVLHKAGRADLVRAAVLPQFERYERQSAIGDFETWLYDDEPVTGELQRSWSRSAWGVGCDPEVLANLVTSVELIAPARFQAFLTRARRRITEMQERGSWRSTWYVGPYYGTYACARALIHDPSAYAQVRDVRRFLEECVRENGGWGHENAPSDPLSTALALCTLRQISPEDSAGLLEQGRRFLLRCMADASVSWDVPFIQMNLGRASGAEGPILTYGSAAISMAFAAQALMENRFAVS